MDNNANLDQGEFQSSMADVCSIRQMQDVTCLTKTCVTVADYAGTDIPCKNKIKLKLQLQLLKML